MPGCLHNMSVPPRSTITAARAQLRGRRFAIGPATRFALVRTCPLQAENELAKQFQQLGAAFALALLEVSELPPTTYRKRFAAMLTEFSSDKNIDTHFADVCEKALSRAGVPDRIGVFLPQDEESAKLARPQPPIVELALLARRSGCLYLPQRAFDASLISWTHGVFFFPEFEND